LASIEYQVCQEVSLDQILQILRIQIEEKTESKKNALFNRKKGKILRQNNEPKHHEKSKRK